MKQYDKLTAQYLAENGLIPCRQLDRATGEWKYRQLTLAQIRELRRRGVNVASPASIS